MTTPPAMLADDFPPGVKDFNFRELIPALRDTPFEYTVTKMTIMLWIAVAVLLIFFLVSYARPKLVPTRRQWIVESVYGFIRDGVCKEVIGSEGVRFAPYLTTLFCFILLTNIFAIIPFLQISPNAHIAFPIVLALISWVLFIWVGIRKHGLGKYLKMSLFPPGIPKAIYPLLTPIEFIQTFVTRPITLAVRLFANMFAGHLILLVFTLGGMALLASSNFALKGFSLVSFGMAIVMTFFELLVQVLQAYVFTILTATYVQGALADEH